MEHDKEKRDIEKTLKINPDAAVPYRKDSSKQPVDIKRFELIYGKPPEDLRGMDSNFSNLKAKIKLKSIKMYAEDVETQKQIEEKAREIPIVVKDKMGRVMEKVYPRMR